MPTTQETYSAAIVQACEAHLVRVKAAREIGTWPSQWWQSSASRIAGLTER